MRNRPKQTISASGGFEMLQMLSEPVIGRCASEIVGVTDQVKKNGCRQDGKLRRTSEFSFSHNP